MKQPDTTHLNRRQLLSISAGAAGLAAAGASVVHAQQRSAYGTKPLRGKKVLVAIGDFSEGMETYYMVYRLMEEGAEPVVAAGSVKRVPLVVHDFEPEYTNYTEKRGYFIESQIAYQDVRAADYHALLVPGGRGPEEIRQYSEALALTRHFLDHKLPLGAMCHGPQLLYAAGKLTGRRIASYPGIRADVENAGATYVDQPAVVDGALVTSRGWPDLPYFMPEFLRVVAAAL